MKTRTRMKTSSQGVGQKLRNWQQHYPFKGKDGTPQRRQWKTVTGTSHHRRPRHEWRFQTLRALETRHPTIDREHDPRGNR